MGALSGMLSDKDIKDQLALGANADLCIDRIDDTSISPVGYDVRAGDTVFSLRKKKIFALEGGELQLVPGDTFFISTYESFALSNRIGGLTVSRVSPLLDGLQMTALTVDPTWNGKLLIVLTNSGEKPVPIKYKQKLMTLCLFWAASPSTKTADRTRWDDQEIRKKFGEIQQAAESRFEKKLVRDVVIVLGVLAAFLGLRRLGVIEKSSDALTLWVATVSLYFSVLRNFFE